MADPLTILGATAAGLQLGEAGCKALIGTITLLRNLRKAPRRMKRLLHETEMSIARLEYVRNTVLQPGSAVASQLSADQLATLNIVISEGQQAIDGLERELEVLVPRKGSTAGPLKRTWKSVVSLTKEDELKEHLENISRANMEILRELAVLGLQSDASLLSLVNQIASNVHSNNQATLQSLDTVHTTLGGLRNTAIDTAQIVAQNQTYLFGTGSTLNHIQAKQNTHGLRLASILDSTNSIQNQMTAIVHVSNSHNEAMRVAVQSAIREEIPALRDAVLGIMAGKAEELSRKEHTAASRLSTAECAELETQIRQQLIMRPSVLREASDFVFMPRRRGMPCNCRTTSLLSTYRRGPFGIKVEYSSQHSPSCRYHRLGRQSWTCAATARLLPFVQKTVELGLNSTSGAGWFSIAPLLRAYCTVKRSESLIFKLFDEFPDRCGRKILGSSPDFEKTSVSLVNGRYDESFQYNWDLPIVKTELIHLIKTLDLSFETKNASGADKDENGNTLLHEASFLISLFPHASKELRPLFQKLIELVVVSGVDVSALAYHYARPLYFQVTHRSRKPCTAMKMLLLMADYDFLTPASQEKLSQSYALIKAAGLDDQLCDMLDWNTMSYGLSSELSRRRLRDVKLLRETPELADPLGFGEIATYILHRSEESLVKYLQVNQPAMSAYEDKFCDPMCIALGWLDGLRILLDAGFEPRKTLEMAIVDEDFASFDFLLPHTAFVEPNFRGDPRNWIFSFLHKEKSHPAMILGVVKEFKFRQNKFREFVNEEMGFELDIYGCRDSPNEQLPDHLSVSMLPSAYHYEVWPDRQTNTFTTLLEMLFEEGFQEVDHLSKDSWSPLCVFASRSETAFDDRNLCAEWFLAKGASASFNVPYLWPNVLFYLLPGLGRRQRANEPLDDDITLYLQDADPLLTDHCDCYCSSWGCLPWHNYWRSFGSLDYESEVPLAVMITMLEFIVELFNLTAEQKELCYAELCRLEVFGGLGLTHTCCGHSGVCRSPMQEEERVQCHQEESELKSQLDLIMAAYMQARRAFAGTVEEFWGLWWEDLGHILPALSSHERHLKMGEIWDDMEAADLMANRADRERVTLVENGYGDFEDFADVIRMHFKRYLEPHALPGEDSDDEWTDTDFSESV